MKIIESSGEAANTGPGIIARTRTAAAHIGTTEAMRDSGLRRRPRTIDAPMAGLHLSDPINSLIPFVCKPAARRRYKDGSSAIPLGAKGVRPV